MHHVDTIPGQLSLAIRPCVGAVSTSESWGVNRVLFTSPVSVVWQRKLVSGGGLRKRRSAPLDGPCGWGRLLCVDRCDLVTGAGGWWRCSADADTARPVVRSVHRSVVCRRVLLQLHPRLHRLHPRQ